MQGAGNGRKQGTQRRADLEQTLAAAVKLHAEADAAGLTGAGKLGQQSSQDGAGQGLLRQRGFESASENDLFLTKRANSMFYAGVLGPLTQVLETPNAHASVTELSETLPPGGRKAEVQSTPQQDWSSFLTFTQKGCYTGN